jgi:hypothetical protein
MATTLTADAVMTSAPASTRSFARRAAVFALIGAALYLALYAAAEALASRYAHRNRFHAIASRPPSQFDYVLLGASHAAVFDYRDMNARLEALAGVRVLNLATVGAGVTLNRLLLDYFRTRHETRAIVYVLDSFAFYSRQWNEDRLRDSRLFVRAPFDPALARLLLQQPGAAWTALDYISGFSKINNPDRFEPDVFVDEGSRFDRVYRPVRQLDEQRLAYLYPPEVDQAVLTRYLAELESMVASAHREGIAFIAIKPPLPDRVRRALPHEAAFDRAVQTVLSLHDTPFHDFSSIGNDERFFFDTDHLNRAGVLAFFETTLAPLLKTVRE